MIAMKEDPMLMFLLASIMKDKSMMEESAKLSLESEKYYCRPFGGYFNQLDEILQLRFVSDVGLKSACVSAESSLRSDTCTTPDFAPLCKR
jgi:hypothetical protein